MNLKRLLIGAVVALGVATTSVAQINLGGLLQNAGKVIQEVAATDNFAATDLIGTWSYVSPGVSFKSENALANVGGAAAGTTIENKLAPYYTKLGIDKMVMTVNDDLTFSIQLAKVKLTGTIAKDEKTKQLVFNFSAYQKVSLGKVNCIAKKSGSSLCLTFDASKVMALAKKVSSVAGNSSFQTINSLLSNYQGLYVGARLNKVK